MTVRGLLSATVDQIDRLSEAEVGSPQATVTQDEALMLRFAAGDMAAFERLHAKHSGALFRYLVRCLSDASLAEEFAQDVWMRLVDARARYSAKAKFRTYLFSIAHNRVVDHYRRQQPISLTDTGLEPIVLDTVGDDRDSEQQNKVLRKALESLPLDQRDALALQIHGEFTLQQIAEMTGVGRETVKSRLRYAMKKLRQVLKEVPGVDNGSE